ncbi:DUF342 domain-containing protein [Paenibacillus hemerocallicola]|uniref:DUF342 domain-containing protein n=1 Tax=Paenibacillus hemerocallicola TaxID=1172614 RepID=A0A5C4TDM8_9BACL|nr:FapA family protein [Paenibacillus hemerocallicola]TNJ67121.1 DUF342 domain-containing protein [Paenibacillus hemerocallicola]
MSKHMTEDELTQLIGQLNMDELESVSTSATRSDFSRRNGSIRIKDQSIIVQDPENGGDLPLIRSVEPVRLYVNDEIVTAETAVSSADRIRWEVEEKPLFEIEVSADKLYAYFQLMSKERYAWRLLDSMPVNAISIVAEEDDSIVLESVHLSEVVAALEQRSIMFQLDIAAIQHEVQQPTYRPVVVARGKAVIPGEDAQLDLYFAEQVESHFFEVGGSVDFRNHLHIPSVKRGEVIAKKIPPVQGIPGFDVYGNIVIPPPPKDIMIVVKSSVELTPEGEIVALKEGRPRITGEKIKTFDISTSYIVSGNVDIETGNIVFSGDVIVYGDVTDNMIIESLGNVYVYGSVYNGTITATGSIFVRENVIGSKLYSGYFGVMFNRLYHSSKLLSELFGKLLAACRMLEQALRSKRQQAIRFGQIVLLLMESKFKEIPATIKDLLVVIANIQHLKREQYQKLKQMSEFFLQPTKLPEAASYNILQSYLALLQDTHQEVARMQEEKVEIRLNQCHKSELKSNGDIVIQREGVLLSDLYSAGNIQFVWEYAVCRGGRLEAGGSISAQIIGGETGASTILKAARLIRIKKMYSGRVCVGKYCTDIFEMIENKTFDGGSFRQKV